MANRDLEALPLSHGKGIPNASTLGDPLTLLSDSGLFCHLICRSSFAFKLQLLLASSHIQQSDPSFLYTEKGCLHTIFDSPFCPSQ